MMKTIAVTSLKGGVGKTTLSVFLAHALVVAGRRVLVVDADPNNNATDYLCRETEPGTIERANLYHALTGRASFDDCIHPVGLGISALPCTPELHRVGIELGANPASVLRFAAHLRKADFDYAIIDTPPAIGYELRLALHAADLVLSPVSPSRWAMQARTLLLGELKMTSEASGHQVQAVTVPSIVTPREEQALRDVHEGPITTTSILKAMDVRRAGAAGRKLSQRARSWSQFASLAAEVSH